MKQTHVLAGKFSKEMIESILGKPSWSWDTEQSTREPCGLAPGNLATAGWGSALACCRIWIHNDGVCIAPALNVESDAGFADAIALVLATAYERIIRSRDGRTE